MAKIFWKPNEMLAVCRAYNALKTDGSLERTQPLSWQKAQRIALPEARWRPLEASSTTSELTKQFEGLKANGALEPPPEALKEALKEAPKEAPPEPKAHAPSTAAPPAAPPAPLEPPAEAAPYSPVFLDEATQEQLVAQLLKLQRHELQRAIEAAIAERIAMAFTAHSGGEEEPVPGQPRKARATAHGLRRYLIVGLLPAQALILTDRIGDLCELRYWKEESTDKLRSHVGWADVTVSMTKFISHSTEDVIKRLGKPLLRCNGGVTDLVTQIGHDIKHHTHKPHHPAPRLVK